MSKNERSSSENSTAIETRFGKDRPTVHWLHRLPKAGRLARSKVTTWTVEDGALVIIVAEKKDSAYPTGIDANGIQWQAEKLEPLSDADVWNFFDWKLKKDAPMDGRRILVLGCQNLEPITVCYHKEAGYFLDFWGREVKFNFWVGLPNDKDLPYKEPTLGSTP